MTQLGMETWQIAKWLPKQFTHSGAIFYEYIGFKKCAPNAPRPWHIYHKVSILFNRAHRIEGQLGLV